MPVTLTQADRDSIWEIVLEAAEHKGGHAQLFSRPLEFEEEGGRVKFHWPDWMQDVRAFIVARHGEKDAQGLLLEVFTEVMSHDAFLLREQNRVPPLLAASNVYKIWR